MLINYALIYINLPTKCHLYTRGYGRSQLYNGFSLAVEYTPVHTHLAWRFGGYVSGVYLIASQNPSFNCNL